MTNKTPEELALEAYMAGLNEKKLKVSDNRLIGTAARTLDPKWKMNVAEANRKKHSDPITKAKLTAANQNRKERLGPEYSQRVSNAQRLRYANMTEKERFEMSEKGKAIWENPEYRERMNLFYSSDEQVKKHTERVREVSKRDDWRKKVAVLNKEKREDPNHIKRHQEAVDKRTQDPEWRRKQAERSKPMVTPDGIFNSRKMAAEFYKVKTPVMNSRMKRYPDQYYYISQEEYIMLTGKEI